MFPCYLPVEITSLAFVHLHNLIPDRNACFYSIAENTNIADSEWGGEGRGRGGGVVERFCHSYNEVLYVNHHGISVELLIHAVMIVQDRLTNCSMHKRLPIQYDM